MDNEIGSQPYSKRLQALGLSTDCSLNYLDSAGVYHVEALGFFLPITRDHPIAAITRLCARPKCLVAGSGLYELRSRRSDPAEC
jgi:hypothetical protein